MRVLIPLFLLVLVGCQSEQPATGAAAQGLAKTCTSYGFRPGTDAFAACMLQLDQNRIAENRRKRQLIGQALSEFGDDLSQGASSNRPINCTSTTYSGITRTNCY